MRRFLFTCFILFCASFASAQNSSALINEALDKQVQLKIEGTLPQAIATIADKTGVRIEATPAVWELLPWGEQTTINARIENQTLRGALQAITRKLGLTFELRDEAVELKPVPPLRRLGRRATVEELDVLDLLSRTPFEPQGDRTSIKQILATVDSKLEAAKSPFAIEDRAFTDRTSAATVAVARNAMLFDALEDMAQATDATWYPWGRTIVIQPKADQIRALLGKTITVRFNGVDIAQVLSELASRSGVDFAIEPGAVQRIAPESRNVKLFLDNASIQQAMESIAGYTGLAWSVNEKGAYVWNPGATNVNAANREPTVGLLTLDNGVQVVLRESQVPPDLREYVKHKTQQQFDKMRQQMKEEGFKPTTQPAAAPATQRSDDL